MKVTNTDVSEKLAANIEKAKGYLARFRNEPLRHHVNGAAYAGESLETFDNHTPVDNSQLGEVAHGTAADIDTAAKAAEGAFRSWRGTPNWGQRLPTTLPSTAWLFVRPLPFTSSRRSMRCRRSYQCY